MSVADLVIEQRHGLGIAAVMARKGASHAAIGAVLGADLPDRAGAAFAQDRATIGVGPGSWLAVQADAPPDFANGLATQLIGLASVSDQSSGYRVLRLSGADARTLLQRGLAIDLHPQSFGPGSAATSVIAHIGVILWQVDDRPAYDIATFSSYAASFEHWLDATIAAL